MGGSATHSQRHSRSRSRRGRGTDRRGAATQAHKRSRSAQKAHLEAPTSLQAEQSGSGPEELPVGWEMRESVIKPGQYYFTNPTTRQVALSVEELRRVTKTGDEGGDKDKVVARLGVPEKVDENLAK